MSTTTSRTEQIRTRAGPALGSLDMYHRNVMGYSACARMVAAALAVWLLGPVAARSQAPDAGVQKLREEVAAKGWLLFSQKTESGDYDLFLCRPDGSGKRNLTSTREWTEFGGRFSPNGKRLFYRRLPKDPTAKPGEAVNHDTWGAAGAPMIANADGSEPQELGPNGGWPWASWSSDSTQMACLYKREGKIRILDLATRKPVRELPRHGIFQQSYWSGDGRRLCGTANLNGQDWNIVSLDLETARVTQVSRNLACTPGWFQKDHQRIVYSCRIPGLDTDYGWTILMQGSADGQNRSLIYGQRGRHIYYGCTSPDDQYAVFAAPESDGGTDAEMIVMRMADAPIVVPGDYKALKELYPAAKNGPVLPTGQAGFVPQWADVELGGK